MSTGNLRRGKAYESLLTHYILKMGGNVAFPIMDEGYDFIATNNSGDIFRVQCKCTLFNCTNGSKDAYKILAATSGRKMKLTKADADILAVHIIPEDCWYFIPVEDINRVTLRFYPNKKDHRFSKYKENWGIFGF